MKKILFLALTISACLISCNRVDVLTETAKGTLSVKVADLADYITVETKSSGIDYADVSNYDVVIDGPYVEELRDITLPMRGSSNQSIIELTKE